MSAPDAKSIRVMIADDHAIFRAGLRRLIDDHPEMVVIGEAGNCAEVIAIAALEQPHIILLDTDLGGESALDLLREMVATCEGAQVIILTGVHDPEIHRRAIALGAAGLVFKAQDAGILIQAIKKVYAGGVWLDPSMMAKMIVESSRSSEAGEDDPHAVRVAALTRREREIITLVAQGLGRKQIAGSLFISETTVRNHLTSILRKLDLRNRFELAIYAYRHKLVRPPA